MIILAGGSSSRFSFGCETPENKVFADVLGVPLIVRVFNRFACLNEFDDILIVSKAADFERIGSILYEFCPERLAYVSFAESGDTRAESSRNGINHAFFNFKSDYVLISDAARCNVSAQVIRSVCDGLKEHDNAIPCVRHEETFKIISEGAVLETMKRSDLFEIQTPQGFRLSKIKEAYDACFDACARDESEIYFRFHKDEKFNIVPGSPLNLKITRGDDMRLFEELVALEAL